MEIKFWGASSGMVTGSCCQISNRNGQSILLDCGMFQGADEQQISNQDPFPFDVQEIDIVILSHAHIDHSGLLPKLYSEGYKGEIWCTPATKGLAELLLLDNAQLLTRQSQKRGEKAIYGEKEVATCIGQMKELPYGRKEEILMDVTLQFQDAGHVLGSAIILLTIDGENLVYSGDLGKSGQHILKDPAKIAEMDYLIMESTYGDRTHGKSEDKEEKFKQILRQGLERGGNILIPAFAVERTQEIIYLLNKLMLDKQIPMMEVFIDSPMAIKATEVFSRFPECYDQEAQQLQRKDIDGVLDFPTLHFCATKEESLALNEKEGGNIIIAANGMCQGGRIQHHLLHNIWREEATILFTGYQAPGTLGRKILDGKDPVVIKEKEIPVRGEVTCIEGFSAHADQKELLEWLVNNKCEPKKIFLVHGENRARDELKKKIEEIMSTTVVCSERRISYLL